MRPVIYGVAALAMLAMPLASMATCPVINGKFEFFGTWDQFDQLKAETKSERDLNPRPPMSRFGLNARWRHIEAPTDVDVKTAAGDASALITVIVNGKQVRKPSAQPLDERYRCEGSAWVWESSHSGSADGTPMTASKKIAAELSPSGDLIVTGEYYAATRWFGRESVLGKYSWRAIFKRLS